jgi:hypothetical protein
MNRLHLTGCLALWLVVACPVVCAADFMTACGGGDPRPDGGCPAPANPCLCVCSGLWSPVTRLSTAPPVPAPQSWVYTVDPIEFSQPILPAVARDPAWTIGPPAECGILPLLI